MIDPDSLTSRLMTRLCDRRASVASKIVLRAMIRAAIDVTLAHDDPEVDVEQTVRAALAMVVP